MSNEIMQHQVHVVYYLPAMLSCWLMSAVGELLNACFVFGCLVTGDEVKSWQSKLANGEWNATRNIDCEISY